MNSFRYLTPKSLNEALGMLSEEGEDAKIIAGGTALVTMMKQRLLMPEVLISLDRIAECRQVVVQENEFRYLKSRVRFYASSGYRCFMSCFILAYLCISRAHKSSNLHSLRSGTSHLSCSDQYSYPKLSFRQLLTM